MADGTTASGDFYASGGAGALEGVERLPATPDATFSSDFRWGLAGATILYALVAFLVFRQWAALPPERPPVPIVPVELVDLGPEGGSPTAAQRGIPPRQRAAPPQTAAPSASAPRPTAGELASLRPPPVRVAPPQTEPPRDALQAQLEALARLRLPPSDASRTGSAAIGAARGYGDGSSAYSVKDIVRAQVERRWNLDLAALGQRDLTVQIRVVVERDGTVAMAEIVDTERSKNDADYRSIALSARNAVLLSSPLTLPAGSGGEVMDMVLTLNPRDVFR